MNKETTMSITNERKGTSAMSRHTIGTRKEWLDARRPRWVMGTPDQARAKVKELEAAGVQRLMLQDFVPRDLEMVRLLGEIFLA